MMGEDSAYRPRVKGLRKPTAPLARHPVICYFALSFLTGVAIVYYMRHTEQFGVVSVVLGPVLFVCGPKFSHGRLARGPLYGGYNSERDRRRALLMYEAMCVGLLLFGIWALVDSHVTQNDSFDVVHVALFGGSTYWGIFYLWGEIISPRRSPLTARE